MRSLLSLWLPVASWMGVIFYSSSQSSLPGPKDRAQDFILKKAGHVFVYTILALLVVRATRESKHPVPYSLAITVLYAMSDEFHQRFVPGREATARDVMIDTAAGGLALITTDWWQRTADRMLKSLRPNDRNPSLA